MEHNKKDYAYIALLEISITEVIKSTQNYLCEKYAKSFPQWPPHITLARGNYLTDTELSVCKNRLSLLKSLPSFTVNLEKFVFKEKPDNTYSLRIAVTKNDSIDELSRKIIEVTQEFEAPIKTFNQTEYWITICGEVSEAEKMEMENYLSGLDMPKEITISSFSIFYSTFNSDKPEEAYQIEKFSLK